VIVLPLGFHPDLLRDRQRFHQRLGLNMLLDPNYRLFASDQAERFKYELPCVRIARHSDLAFSFAHGTGSRFDLYMAHSFQPVTPWADDITAHRIIRDIRHDLGKCVDVYMIPNSLLYSLYTSTRSFCDMPNLRQSVPGEVCLYASSITVGSYWYGTPVFVFVCGGTTGFTTLTQFSLHALFH